MQQDGTAARHRSSDDAQGAPWILTLDVGSTSVRAFLMDRTADHGDRVAARPITSHYPQAGHAEQDPEQVWLATLEATRQVLKDHNVHPKQVAAMAVATQRASVLTWDARTSEPLHPMLLWSDQRTAEFCRSLNTGISLRGVNAVSTLLHAVTRANKFCAGSHFKFNPLMAAARLAWVLKEVPGAGDMASSGHLRYGGVDTWLLWKLTGGAVWATDLSSFSATGFFDPWTQGVNGMVLKMLHVPAAVLPECRPTSGDFGATEPSLFSGVSIPIRALVADQQASMFGNGCFARNAAKATLGTGTFVSINSGPDVYSFAEAVFPLVAWKVGDRSAVFMTEGGASTCGTALNWGAQAFGLYDEPSQMEAIARTVPDTQGVYFVPALMGLRAPHNNASAKAALIGMTAGTTRAHIVRAMLEAPVYRLCDLVITINKGPNRITTLTVDGGVSNSDFVCQFAADMLHIPITRAGTTETTAVGATLFAGIAVGWYSDPDAVQAILHQGQRFEPQMAKEERERRWEGWVDACQRVL